VALIALALAPALQSAAAKPSHAGKQKLDSDGDGLSNWTERRRTHTNPHRADTDGEGLRDRTEVRRTKTSPRRADTDSDGLTDWTEVRITKTNPRRADSDGDGYTDLEELLAGTDPWNPASFPVSHRALTATIPPPAPSPRSDTVKAVWSPPTDARTSVPVELDGTSSIGNGALSCTWSFEDQSGSTVFHTEEGCAIDFTFQSTGTKFVRLSVTDTSGGSATNKQSFVVGAGPDITPPNTTIGSGPLGVTAATSASFSFSSTESGSSFECKLDSGTFAACSSPKAYSGLSEGDHTFSVRATDAAGNVDPSPASRSWTVDTSIPPDTTPPDTTIGSGPSGATSSTSASFSFSSSEDGSSFECKLDSGTFSSCSSPQTYSGLDEGAHTFSVRATDSSGNVDLSPASRTWTVEASEPPPEGAGCFSEPGACGYPTPSTTGVPSGTALTASGPITVTTPGTVIEGKDVTGGIDVQADDVTIRNSRVSNGGDCGTTTTCGGWVIRALRVTGLKIENVETSQNGTDTCEHDIRNQGPSAGTVEVVDSYLHACDASVYSVGPFTLRDSYSLSKIDISEDHIENIYFDGTNFTAIHDTLFNPVNQTAVIFGNTNNGSGGTCENHLTVEDSLLAGGGYTLYPCGNASSAGSSTWVIKNNHFARCRTGEKEVSGGHWVCQSGFDQYGYYPRGGSFGLVAYSFSSGRTWSGNVWDDNLATISAP
jgi:hypothetical protein